MSLAGPQLATRQALFDFIVEELGVLEALDARRIRPVRIALQNQRDDLLAFASSTPCWPRCPRPWPTRRAAARSSKI
ncbi:hypothetical protein [Paraburkholderia sp. 40]|uniref:hypothetical protein n=1 Tax=unclassified Paraburkholderia TaxID=2615204 RepID=UPI003D223A80